MLSPSQDIPFEPLKQLLVEMAHTRDATAFFPWSAHRLLESYQSAAAAAIWELGSSASLTTEATETEDGDGALLLVGLAMRARGRPIAVVDPRLEHALRKWPLSSLEMPVGAADPEWARREEVRRFVSLRLEHKSDVVGALGVFFRDERESPMIDGLRLVANQLALVMASERAFGEVRRLQRQIDVHPGALPSSPNAPVMTEVEIRRFERANIVAALRATGGRVYGRGGAADLIGIKPTTLASRMKKLGLSPHS